MAGRLPGVGLLPRKRTEQPHRYEHHATYRHSHPRDESSLEPPWLSISVLDDTALKARQRLQKKLGHFFSSSRSSEKSKKEGKESQSNKQRQKDVGLGRKLLESSWLLRPNKFKKERKVCAVCLEDCQQQQQVMNLSCSHKYHSACLLPWLATHPHCPYCRTPVEPS
ncbi:E3 ubiquitin-protein ligase RNF38-like [Abrus precatorius]|uniref:E3 ubiquitin-protein ligase RNF38-like n=1 Tax=Abrus precatorius TaxID=3816 RepID=A0A8B8ME71_ABRPR|nr:E3 ubiquitin-protein ligase RNF38-like [Abrus precatorius]